MSGMPETCPWCDFCDSFSDGEGHCAIWRKAVGESDSCDCFQSETRHVDEWEAYGRYEGR